MGGRDSRQIYVRAMRDQPSLGVMNGLRPEPTLDDVRAELSEAISRVAASIFKANYGPLVEVVSQSAINAFLKGFEFNLSRAKGDLTIVFQELLDRVMPKIQQNK